MNNCDLRDLVLAGVQWEITDVPMAMAAATRAATVTQSPSVAPGRTQTSVVPPIAPQQTMCRQLRHSKQFLWQRRNLWRRGRRIWMRFVE